MKDLKNTRCISSKDLCFDYSNGGYLCVCSATLFKVTAVIKIKVTAVSAAYSFTSGVGENGGKATTQCTLGLGNQTNLSYTSRNPRFQ